MSNAEQENDVEILTRRNFIAQTISVGCACAAACIFAEGAAAQTAPKSGKGVVVGPKVIGPLTTFAKQPDGIYDAFAKAPTGFLVVISEGKVYAMTSVCTHKQELMQTYKDDKKQAYCPKHESLFDIDGTPAALGADGDKVQAREPLSRHGITVNAKGQLVVDTSKTFTYAQKDDAGAFVAIEKKGSSKPEKPEKPGKKTPAK